MYFTITIKYNENRKIFNINHYNVKNNSLWFFIICNYFSWLSIDNCNQSLYFKIFILIYLF